jgi:short-subunit dehydrogenase
MAKPWTSALVTGASSGIGRAIALDLALKRGVDVVAVARDRGRLEALAQEVAEDQKGTSAKVEVLVADLADAEQLAQVEARVAASDRPVDLLVNNAGFGTYGVFPDLPIEGEEREIKVNVVALVRLTHAALGAMRERGDGTILNVSSIAGLQATPGNATYGATKAYVASFTEAVHEEAKRYGVDVTAVLPGYTRTEFQTRAGIDQRGIPKPLWQDAEACAAQSLDAAAAGKPFFIPGLPNKVFAAAAAPFPRGIKRRLAARLASRY